MTRGYENCPQVAQRKPLLYTAPALAKGLLILEALAEENTVLTASEIAHVTKHTPSEIFRPLQVLIHRGYVSEVRTGGGYQITSKMFDIAMQIDIYKDLTSFCISSMTDISATVKQAVFLSIISENKHVIISSVDSPGDFTVKIRPGSRTTLLESTPGKLIFALSSPPDSQNVSKSDTSGCRTIIARANRQMWLMEKNHLSEAITDISVPIFYRGKVRAALTIPYLSHPEASSLKKCFFMLRRSARALSEQISA